ncbi:M23 family metallopeptidase [Pelagerythrobacter sp.]|uniref:M23 family metallopeptidase n=1 Tax=Pelagerythrobacter sp. TaxID=2800702 RepID=UPI0035B15A49
MALNVLDRVLTIVVTATLTSAVWIVAGGSFVRYADSEGERETTQPAEAAPSPVATDTGAAAAIDSRTAERPAAAAARDLLIPVLNIRAADLTDTFTDERGDGTRLHEAIDIMAPRGTTVVAAAPGRIEKLFKSGAGGNTIYVRGQDGETIYYYAHLDRYAEGLKDGQRIRRGQRLGAVGSTGNAPQDAPHLHFAILRTTADADWWEPANAINPFPLLTGRQGAGR